jgi:hypothetical protein
VEQDVTPKASHENAWRQRPDQVKEALRCPRSESERREGGNMGFRERIEQARLKRALASERKKKEREQKTEFEIRKEQKDIADLKRKRELQRLKERRRSLERKTGTGVRGFVARTQRARAKVTKRRVSFTRRASKTRLAALKVGGLPPTARAKRVIRKPRKRKRKKGFFVSLDDMRV